jgi:hypothetical protein
MTGRGFGYCGGVNAPGTQNSGPFFRKGFGFGRRRGHGWRRGKGFGQGNGENEAEILRLQARQYEESLEQLNKKLIQLEEQTKNQNKEKKG